MKIRKLPSGTYHAQIQVNGKRYSITGRTRAEVEEKVAERRLTLTDAPRQKLGVLVDKYISIKENVLSPSTIKGYKQIRRTYLPDLMDMQADRITSDVLQASINELSLNHSPKTVRNIIGLVISTLKVYAPKTTLNVSLPQRKRPTYNVPTTEDVFRLIESANGHLKTAIMLAAFCGLRRGEIVALDASDLNGNVLHIQRAAVFNEDNEIVVKSPKTYQSDRFVTVPDIVLAHIADLSGLICPMKLYSLTRHFIALRDRLGLSCRFHDLRHYYASFQHAIDVPDAYIMQSGGWKSDSILKSVYRNTLDDERRRNDEKINTFLTQSANKMQTECRQTAQILRLLTGSSPVAPIRYEDPESP